MKREPMPFTGQDALSLTARHTHLPAKPIILLLAISAALLLGIGYMLFDSKPAAQPQAPRNEAPRRAPTISGKTEIQLRADLVRVKQELEQARAEREATRKAIAQVSRELQQKLKQAQLTE